MGKTASLVLSDGTEIFYKEEGKGEALFLLHGNNQDLTYFDKNIEGLKDYFHIYRIDFRDHGKSTNTKDCLTFELMAKDLKEVYGILGIKKAHILGFSDGANLALVFNKAYKDLVEGLVLNSPNVRFDGITPFARVLALGENIFWSILPFFKRNKRVARLLLTDLKVSKEDLESIDKKVLLIVGKNDIISLSHTRAIAGSIPDSRLVVVPKEGHKLAQSSPEIFNNYLLEFLKGRKNA